MSNKFLSILILLIFLFNLIPSINVYAKTITIDGDPSDWTGTAPADPNTFVYSNGEWIWKDAQGDERTDFTNPDPQVDLLEFRVSGDTNYLYLLFIFNFPADLYIGDNGATFIALAIDRDRTPGSGVEWFGGESETRVSDAARWEYQLIINLADSRYNGQNLRSVSHPLDENTNNWGAIFQLIDTTWSHIYQTGDDGTYGLLAVNLDNNAIEVRLSWSLIGGMPDGTYVRFTLITARGWSDYDGNGGGTWDANGSDALDTVTTATHTWIEVQDGVVDYYVDVYFVNGEPVEPPPPQYRVYGYVVDQYNDPVVGATVALNGYSTTTGSDGYFELLVGSGTYVLTISKAGYETYISNITVEADTDLGTITIHKFLVNITSNVNDFSTGAKAYEAPALLTATGNDENALKYLYIDFDDKYLYIGTDFYAGTWGLAFGIGIDANPGTTLGYGLGESDSWSRKIGFKYAYIDYQAYFWVSDGSVQAVNFYRYNYATGTWEYNVATIYYSPLAAGHDGNTLFKVAIPLNVITGTQDYGGNILIVVWIAGGDGSSAVSALPLNPLTLSAGGGEWGDTDVIYTYVKVDMIAKSFSPYPTDIATTIATDKDTYEVYVGYPVNIGATLTDAENSPLMHQTLYIVEKTDVSGVTDFNGKATLTITDLAEGTYTFTVKYDGHWSWSGSTKTVTVIVTTPPATYRVYGYVKDYTGAPVSDAKVELLDTNLNDVKSTSSGADGYYEITDVVPGTYFIRVTKTGYAKWLKQVVVDADKEVSVTLYPPRVDMTRPVNDFPAGSLVYKALKPLSNQPGAKHNVSMIYVTWDTEYLYIGFDLVPEDWWIAIGIGIDVNPGTQNGFGAVFGKTANDWRDAWNRKINFTTPYGVGPVYPEILTYLWYQGTDGVTAAQIIRYKYESYPPIVGPAYGVEHWEPWDYGYGTPGYVIATKSGELTKIAIPWEKIMFLPGIEYTGEIAIIVWVTHGEPSSALSAAPLNPLVHDSSEWGEWGDHDVLYMSVRLTYDSDKDYLPEIVRADQVRSFYPEITTTVETDKDVYEVGAGATFTIKARVKNALDHYLPYVKVQVIDHEGKVVGEGITTTQTGGEDAFTTFINVVAPTDKGTYNWTVRFVGEAGFLPSAKTITLNVPRYGSRIVDVSVDLTYDLDFNGRISPGDVITVRFKLEGFVGGVWSPLSDKTVYVKFNYTYNGIVDTISVITGPDGYGIATYTIRSEVLADILLVTIEFPGDADYAPATVTRVVEILLRIIDGSRLDWGTELPRSTPGIAPRVDEIVVTDPVGDINRNPLVTGKYAELDIAEVRITWDGVYVYFYVKFAGPLSDNKHFTVNIAIDATPDNPLDGFSEWLYGYWFTDIRLGGFDAYGRHVDVWKWTHVIEAVPIDNRVEVRVMGPDRIFAGKLSVNTDEGFIEFSVPCKELRYLDFTEPFRVWIIVFGVEGPGKYLAPVGANAIDIAGVGDTNLEVLTYRDPDWANLVWPREDIWVDNAFIIKFSKPATPDIPDPSPAVPPTSVKILGIIYNGSFITEYEGDRALYGLVLIQVKGTQGRPVTVTIGDKTFTGVVGGDDVALVPVSGPSEYRGYLTITASSDGVTDETTIFYIITWLVPPAVPEPWIIPLIILAALIALLFKKRE